MADRSVYVLTSKGYYESSLNNGESFNPELEVTWSDAGDEVYIRIHKVGFTALIDKETASELSTKISELLASA